MSNFFSNFIFKNKETPSRLENVDIISYERKDAQINSYLFFQLSNGEKISITVPSLKDAGENPNIRISEEQSIYISDDGKNDTLSEEEITQFLTKLVVFTDENDLNIFYKF